MEVFKMEKMTKKAWIEYIKNQTMALVGAPRGQELEAIQKAIDSLSADAIKYTNKKLNEGRKVFKVTQKEITFKLSDGRYSYLQTKNGKCYKHNAPSGEYLIIYFEADGEFKSVACIYVVSKTGE